MRARHVVVAPDKFKGSMRAADVASHLGAGIAAIRPSVPLRLSPVADGGEGTVEAALAAGFSAVERVVAGPTGAPTVAQWACKDDTAVIEAALAAGVARLEGGVFAPLVASSFGVGELVLDALEHGSRRVIVGLGGTACTDGGAGFLQALGGRLIDRTGAEVARGGAALRGLEAFDGSGLDQRLSGVEVVIAADVDSMLLGPQGAAPVFSPQKGASPEEVAVLEAGLTRYADVIEASVGRTAREVPGTGAAGGIGFAAHLVFGAALHPGIEVVLELLDFSTLLDGARLVVTGEGRIDATTLNGKAPRGVAYAARRAGVEVVAVAGTSTLDAAELKRAGFSDIYLLSELEPDVGAAIADPGPLLEQAGGRLARRWLDG